MMHKMFAYLPHVAAIWGLGLLVALIAGEPLLRVTPHALDDEVYRSNGLLLAEGFRVLGQQWGRAALVSAGILSLGHLIVLLLRGRLTRQVVHLTANLAKEGPWQQGIFRYVGVYFLGRAALALLAAGFVYGALQLPSKGGTWAPGPVSLQVAWLLFGAVAGICLLVLFDLWALAVFFRTDQKPVRLALSCLRKDIVPLLAGRFARSFLSLVTAIVVARLVLSSPLEGLGGAALALSLSQLLVLTSLVVDILWLEFAARHLARQATTTLSQARSSPTRAAVQA